ncbi:MAG TPA: phytanoyl-CoA dioxygenase family protein [Chloroflexota bacterium]
MLLDSFVADGFGIVDVVDESQHAVLQQLVLCRLADLARNEPDVGRFELRDLAEYHRLEIPAEAHRRLLSGTQRFVPLTPEHEAPFLAPALFPIMDYLWGQHDDVSIKRVDLEGNLVDHQCGFRVVRPQTADATLPHTDSDDGAFSLFTVWLPLVGFDSRYSLKVFPGTHRCKHPSDAIVRDDRFAALPYSAEYVSQFESFRPDLRKGQGIVFHNELLHGAADNLGDATRVSLEVRVFGQA